MFPNGAPMLVTKLIIAKMKHIVTMATIWVLFFCCDIMLFSIYRFSICLFSDTEAVDSL